MGNFASFDKSFHNYLKSMSQSRIRNTDAISFADFITKCNLDTLIQLISLITKRKLIVCSRAEARIIAK